MSGLKIFKNKEESELYEIVEGDREVDEENFLRIKRMLLPINLAVSKKNDSTKCGLNILQIAFPEIKINQQHERKLLEDPLLFKLNLKNDHPAKTAQGFLQRLSTENSTLIMNYKIAFSIIDFLFKRSNKSTQLYMREKQKNIDLMKEITDLKIKLKKFEEPEYDDFEREIDTDLVLTDDEINNIVKGNVEVDYSDDEDESDDEVSDKKTPMKHEYKVIKEDSADIAEKEFKKMDNVNEKRQEKDFIKNIKKKLKL